MQKFDYNEKGGQRGTRAASPWDARDKEPIMPEIKTNEKPPMLAQLKVVGIVFVVLALFVYLFVLPAVDTAFEAAHKRDCWNHIKQIAYAMYSYHDQYEAFPPAYTVDADGKPLHSWRTMLLPFLECEDMYGKIKFGEPWNSDYNRQFHDQMPKAFSCWNGLKYFRRDKESKEKWKTTMTAYQVVVGHETLFPGSECRTLNDVTRKQSETIMVVESTVGVCWMAPLDLPVEALEHGVIPAKSGIFGIGSYHDGGVYVVMVDGSAVFILNSKSSEDVRVLKKQLRIMENEIE